MKNSFYNDFDLERLSESKRINDYRTHFQIDRDRIIHSSEFRRLQGKTQVFIPGEYDFYRTRLTHSIEVAQIGRSICNFLLMRKESPINKEYYIDSDLVEAICLAHDLGHPPFGHAGERTLNTIMKVYGGFEGNAQTLRLITEIFYRRGEDRRGMNPTRVLIDGVMKYKSLFSNHENAHNHYLYDNQLSYLGFVFGSNYYVKFLNSIDDLNNFRSIECQIMDWADDTAYAINDIVDSISGNFITIYKLVKWKEKNENKLNPFEIDCLDDLISWIKGQTFKAKLGTLIGDFIRSCSLEEQNNFMNAKTNRYRYKLVVEEESKARAELYKRIAKELVFKSPQLHQMEFKGNQMIAKIFEVLEDNYVSYSKHTKLIGDFSDKIIRQEKNEIKRARLVCDNIAGMTDSFAMRTYKRLFDPDYSSLDEIV